VAEWLQLMRRHWVALLLAGAALGLFASGLRGYRGVSSVVELRRELSDIESQSFDLLQQGHEVRHRLDTIRHDDDELERVARQQLHLVRPGEVLYVFDDPRHPPRPGSSRGAPSEP
jgi:cell division protein FtsB